MKNKLLLPLIGLLALSFTACNQKGDTGATGPQGEQGIQGEKGDDGVDGKDGTSMLTGDGVPSNELGNENDSYVNTLNWDYYVKVDGMWVLKGNIKGSNGQDAIQYIPVIFNNYDGTMLYTFYYEKGSDIVYDGPTPTREGYIQDEEHYVYDWTGWDKSLENIQAPTIFTAQYELKNITKEYNISIGKIPNVSEDGKTITYGLYPQTNVNDDEALVAALDELTTPEANGYYLYNNKYYAKQTANPYEAYSFDNGRTIVSGVEYWFRCEPITWNVLANNEGKYTLFSSSILDTKRFDSSLYAKYENSEIRTWLNADFYDSAFGLNNSFVQTTYVDNSASTTDSNSNPYICNDTEDKVFLMSYQELINEDYGFPDAETKSTIRQRKATDYAKANGIYLSSYYDYAGSHWTRSHYSGDKTGMWKVYMNGTFYYSTTPDQTFNGVCPAITIKIA